MKIIDNFDEEYYFLSNFTYSPFYRNRVWWETVEHFFQAMKTIDLKEREKIRKVGHPRFAKKFGRKVKLRSDWEQIKYQIMYNGVTAKFVQNFKFANLLKQTGNAYLIEGNWWHDNIWGDCHCNKCKNIKGTNWLGEILMKVREEI